MLFNNNDGRTSDRILYQTKPNMLFGCKKAILGVIILIIILSFSSVAVKFIGNMQVYMISYVKLPLTSYVAIAFFVIILINVIYIIWQLVGWYSVEYTLTDTKIIIKSGIISTKKNYMPYAAIQDLNTSQNIVEKVFSVGSVSVFSAYDNNLMELSNISNPSEVEEIIFSRMVGSRNFQAPPQRFPQQEPRDRFALQDEDYLGRNDYYDEFEPITPITHESNYSPRREYEYYPEDYPLNEQARHQYDYEPYDAGYNNPPRGRSQGNHYNQPRDDYGSYDDGYNNPPRGRSQGNHYNQPMDDYHYREENYHPNGDRDVYYEEVIDDVPQKDEEDMSGEAIKRHFDKFKR